MLHMYDYSFIARGIAVTAPLRNCNPTPTTYYPTFTLSARIAGSSQRTSLCYVIEHIKHTIVAVPVYFTTTDSYCTDPTVVAHFLAI